MLEQFDVLLKFAGEKLAALGVETRDIGADEKQRDEHQKGNGEDHYGLLRAGGCVALDEAGRETEPGAELLLEPAHLAAIGFVVVPGQMQHAVEDENFHFGEQVVADLGGLAAGALERNGDVAGSGASGTALRLRAPGGKGKHVGRLVLVAELQVEALHLGVAGEQDVHLAGESGCALSLVRKTRQGKAAKVFRFSSL